MKNMPFLLLMGLSLIAFLGLSGCGDGSPPSSGGSSNTATGSNSTGNTSNAGDSNQAQKPSSIPEKPAPAGFVAQNSASTKFWYIHLDNSSSMDSSIEDAKRAIIEFIDQAPADLIFGLAVYEGNYSTREAVPFSLNSREQIKSVLGQIIAETSTPIDSAITFSTDRLVEQQQRQLGYGQYNLLVVTDGSTTTGADKMERSLDRMNKAGVYNAPICLYTIGYNLSTKHALASRSVKYLEARDRASLVKAFVEATKSELEDLESLQIK